MKKRKRTVRRALVEAWWTREEARRRQAGIYTLDGARALEYHTKTYNDKRAELAKCMTTGELSEEDAKVFPHLSATELRAPRVRPSDHQATLSEPKADMMTVEIRKEISKPENAAPKSSAKEMEDLKTKAINARNLYVEAHAYFKRPPPQGRSNLKDLRAQGEMRIERASKLYAKTRDDLRAAFGGEMPAELKEKLFTYDDKAAKKSRDAWLVGT